ncbi:MAG: hypothetical protein PUF49_06775 [Firmicutes bacterium]|nr:hypothetical protein [Bacillota bacterium]
MKKLTRNQIALLFYFALISFAVLLFASRSSFLYPMNNWDDSNSYFTMGKSMFRGILIYRDIFDQKGPYLYLIYGLASLISRTTFTGVFLFEILFGILDLAGYYKILRLQLRKETALILLPFLFAVTFSSFSFYWGGCAEEFCLPALVWTLYLLLPRLQNKTRAPFSCQEVLTAGLLCGYVACIKFTLLGFFFAFMLMVLFRSGRVVRFLKSCGVFLLGMALPAVPWLIYFGIHGALSDWYHVYIYTNVFLYSTFGAASRGESAGQKIYALSKILYWLFFDNFQYFIFIAAGMLFMFFRRGADLLQRLAVPVLFVFTFLGIYIGGAHLPYYAFPLTVFAVFGFLATGVPAEAVYKKLRRSRTDKKTTSALRRGAVATVLCCIAAAALSSLIVYALSPNSYYLSYTKDDVFLTRFAKDIREDTVTEHTLLNYNCLDCGLYTAADIDPTCYWFQTQTLAIPDVFDEQHRYIREGRTGFVVCRDDYPDFITDHYEMMDRFHQVMGDTQHDYYLFRKVK